MKPETRFYEYLKKILPATWMLQRIETTTAVGVPDLNILIPDIGELWAEIKSCKTRTKIRREQYAWITKRHYLGGKAIVINRDKNKEIQIWSKKFDIKQAGGRYLTITNKPDATFSDRFEIRNLQNYLTLLLTETTKTEKNQNE